MRYSVKEMTAPENAGYTCATIHAVLDESGKIVSRHYSNSAAWRAVDKLNGEAMNRSEDTADWSFSKRANGEWNI